MSPHDSTLSAQPATEDVPAAAAPPRPARLGRYRIDDVPRGRYVIGFFHPNLDSLTLEPIVRQIVVAGDIAVAADLGIPSGGRLRSALCTGRGGAISNGAFVGVVRDSRDAKPLGGVPVVAEWWDMVVGRGTIGRAPSRRATTSSANGLFPLLSVSAVWNVASVRA